VSERQASSKALGAEDALLEAAFRTWSPGP
jgi:hypothetical protein